MDSTILAKAFYSIFACLFICSSSLNGQNRAPSCWLKYNDHFSGDIITNTIMAKSPSPLYTYYCGLQWNAGIEGGGYCGMQEHPDGRNFIYSIWDPKSSTEPIVAEYAHPGTEVENFGGEGTGLKSWNFEIGWETNQWYNLTTRSWTENGHTKFGFWVYDNENQIWHHLVTMDYPVANINFASNTGTFIEDWLGNGDNVREVAHKNGWKRNLNYNWSSFDEAIFERVSPDAGADNYINNYDGGNTPEYYWMRSGGSSTTPQTTESGNSILLENQNTNHSFPKGEHENLNIDVVNLLLRINWEIPTSSTPQFSYQMEIFDNIDMLGPSLLSHEIKKAHFRSDEIDISSLADNKKYYIKFTTEDIFGQLSEISIKEFTLGIVSSTHNLSKSKIIIFPNPVFDIIKIDIEGQLDFTTSLYDLNGKLILATINSRFIQIGSFPSGTYILELEDRKTGQKVVERIVISK